jgi:predicted ATPase/class 3 adenylate cyclase
MRALPSGTVTLMFTDIEGSTRLLRELGDGYAGVLAEHRRVVRDSVAVHRGVEVDTQGDAFFVAFSRASDAAAAAWDVQRSLEDGLVRVRIGLHSGEPAVTDEGYVGLDVHRGARVMAAGHGGQILLSERTRALLDDDPRLRDLGTHRLKDFSAPERLFQLGEATFPPLRTLDATNVPRAANPLLGREQELRELVALVGDEALVTITGPGGTGKTRLAIEAAGELVGAFRDGVFWVPLAGLADAGLVTAEIAQAVGAQDDLAGFVRDRELLLLLDNFEHLIAAAPTLRELLSRAGRLHVLVTSRAPLRVSGERQYRLEPLAPDDAVALFTARAEAVGAHMAASGTIEAICGRLDRLPLAIELAAARTNLLSPESLLQRLTRILPLLTAGTRDAPERQRALRATIEWSHQLLDDGAKRVFARLSVFAGSFSPEAAEQVGESELDGIDALVDASLLKPVADGRLLLLETIKEFAAERLQASDDEQHVRQRHADYYAAFVESRYRDRFEHEGDAAAALEADHDNLRAALDWYARHDPGAELRLAGALGWFWISHSHLAEGTRRLAEAMERAPLDGPSGARALVAAGGLAGRRGGEAERAREQLERGIALWRRIGGDDELASALDELGWMFFFSGGKDSEGLRAFEESLRLRSALGDRAGTTRALVGVCQLLVAQGEIARAEELSNELLELARADDDVRSVHFAQHYLADCSLIRGDYDRAAARYRESLETVLGIGDVLETSFEIQGIAMSAAGQGDRVRAVTLAAAVEALWEERGIGISVPFWDGLLEQHVGGARRGLGAEAEARWSEGRKLTLDEAIALALGSG